MIDSILNNVLNFIVGALATWAVTKYRTQTKVNSALKLGMQALLRDRIIQGYNHYVQGKKWIPIYAYDALKKCYDSYEDLGENGVIDDLMEELKSLPHFPPKEDDKQ